MKARALILAALTSFASLAAAQSPEVSVMLRDTLVYASDLSACIAEARRSGNAADGAACRVAERSGAAWTATVAAMTEVYAQSPRIVAEAEKAGVFVELGRLRALQVERKRLLEDELKQRQRSR